MGNRTRESIFRESLRRNDQGHVLPFLDELPPQRRRNIFDQLETFDLATIRREVLRIRRPAGEGNSFRPASCFLLSGSPMDEQRRESAIADGIGAIERGEIAALMVAGGQASRLGSDRAKGLFPITPVQGKSFFQLFAEKIRASEIRHGRTIPWLILTSPENHGETVEFFAQNGNFGLRELHLFPQGLLPTMDGDGRLILASRDSLAMHPDGHGGVLQALGRTSGLLDRLRRLGVRHLSYFQVDNPLLLPVDPLFIGFHLQERAQISSRCVRKAYAGERVGVFVEMDGRLRVVEYMDLPAECASATDITNQLRFCWANIAAHIFDLEFLIPHCTGERSPLPLHLSTKKTPFLNASGHLVRPTEANGIKLERFIFDLLPHAERTLLLEGKREEVFSPAKNLIGLDSVETCRRDQMRQFADWLSKGKADILRDAEGIPPFPLEISPLFADSCREFLRKWGSLDPKPATCANFYLE